MCHIRGGKKKKDYAAWRREGPKESYQGTKLPSLEVGQRVQKTESDSSQSGPMTKQEAIGTN